MTTTTHTTHTTMHIPDAVIEQWQQKIDDGLSRIGGLHPYLTECLESGKLDVEPTRDPDEVDFHLQTSQAYLSFTASRVAGTEWKMRLFAAGEYNGPQSNPYSRAKHIDVPSGYFLDVIVVID